MQSDSTFEEYATEIGQITKEHVTHENPGIIMLDGHSSHLTTRALDAFEKYDIFDIKFVFISRAGFYVVCEESLTSSFQQALDLGPNANVDLLYSQVYSTKVALHPMMTFSRRFECVLEMWIQLQKIDFSSCWAKMGMKNGKLDAKSLKAEIFKAGA